MSYSVRATGTRSEVRRTIRRQLAGNTSPEAPAVEAILLEFVGAVEGADKRVHLEANGSHWAGNVEHRITLSSVAVHADDLGDEEEAAE